MNKIKTGLLVALLLPSLAQADPRKIVKRYLAKPTYTQNCLSMRLFLAIAMARTKHIAMPRARRLIIRPVLR